METKKPFWQTTSGILLGCIALVVIALLCVCIVIFLFFSADIINQISTTTPTPNIKAPASAQPKPSGFISSVTMAEGTQGANKDPVNPTTTFGSNATFHAVVRTQNAPANTKFKAAWYAVDVGNAAPPNTLIDQTEVTTDGTRNIDFTLSPRTAWPAGTYRVEIYVNDVLDTVKPFNVK